MSRTAVHYVVVELDDVSLRTQKCYSPEKIATVMDHLNDVGFDPIAVEDDRPREFRGDMGGKIWSNGLDYLESNSMVTLLDRDDVQQWCERVS